jgi:hypothetical protein
VLKYCRETDSGGNSFKSAIKKVKLTPEQAVKAQKGIEI